MGGFPVFPFFVISLFADWYPNCPEYLIGWGRLAQGLNTATLWFKLQGHGLLRAMSSWNIYVFYDQLHTFFSPRWSVQREAILSSFWRSRETVFINTTEGASCCPLWASQAKMNLQMQAVNPERCHLYTCLWWFLYRSEHRVMSGIKKLLPLSPNGHIIISRHFI